MKKGSKRPPGYEPDERSAAVDKVEDQRKPEDFIGRRKPGYRTDDRILQLFGWI